MGYYLSNAVGGKGGIADAGAVQGHFK